jgi:hypothetical protein
MKNAVVWDVSEDGVPPNFIFDCNEDAIIWKLYAVSHVEFIKHVSHSIFLLMLQRMCFVLVWLVYFSLSIYIPIQNIYSCKI